MNENAFAGAGVGGGVVVGVFKLVLEWFWEEIVLSLVGLLLAIGVLLVSPDTS